MKHLALCAATAIVLSLSGYVPNATQSETALDGINFIMTVLPAAFGAMAVVPLMWYRLDEAQFARIVADLRLRGRAAQ